MPSSRPPSSRGRNTPDSAAFDSPKLKANRHLILDNSAASSATSVSNSRASEAASSAHNHSHGLLNTLHHLLPRHAQFNVCIQIHQIDNIPLTQGEFAVRWRLKNTTNGRRKTAGASAHSLLGFVGKGKKQKSADADSIDEFNSRSPDHLERHGPVIPSVVVVTDSPTHRPTPLPSSDSSSSTNSSSSSSVEAPFSSVPHSEPEPLCRHDEAPTPPKGMTPFLPLKDHSVAWSQSLHTTVKMSISRSKSSSTANTTSSGDENGLLLSSPLTLVVVQRVIPGDPGAPRNPRLGAVYLDLAEYAGVEGETTRRYLLRESKINATLKLTISVTHVGGETHFTAPPLPKGEILNGISGILERDVYKTRPKALDLYGPYYNYSQHQRELAVGLRPNSNSVSRTPSHGLSDTSDEEDGHDNDRQFFASHEDLQRTIHLPPHPKSKSHIRSNSLDGVPTRPTPHRTQTDPTKAFSSQSRVARISPLSPIAASPLSAQSQGSISPLSSGAIPFDVSHLPFAYGPKTTETLIEAIFNPVPVAEKPGVIGNRTKIGRVPVEDNPFVYFIPKEEQEQVTEITIGRSFTRQTSLNGGGTFLRPKSSGGRTSSMTSRSNEMGDASSVYSTTSGPSSSAASFVTLGSIASKSSSSKEKSSSSEGSNHDEQSQSEAHHMHSGKGWLRRHHKETRIIAQSNPHGGTRPDLYGRVDSVVGIVL